MNTIDIIVIGGGHAGIEASLAAARMGCSTVLITMSREAIGRLSCNPSIGGSAKGHLVKEIDALGGAMGEIADKSGLQFKMLNKSKGPAIWSPRSQNDIDMYPAEAQRMVGLQKNLTVVEAAVTEILVKNDKIQGVILDNNETLSAQCVVLCSGTFLNGVMHTGTHAIEGGRVGERSATKISDVLASYGLEKGRLKTGTPPRISADSIDYSLLELHPGDELPLPFSRRTASVANRIVCYNTYTNEYTHDILREGFEDSPMFAGRIQGAGPRYCPSIEDKINRFANRDSHQVVLEPEGLQTRSVYVNGFSTSLPIDIQIRGLHSIPGLKQAKMLRAGYAVEYDFFFPYQLRFTLETKAIDGLYFAGQINGTSGYEEAASQGLVAGINAALKVKGEGEFTPKRSEAYIGVLIDDLVNKNTEEPYRIFTSLAEYRLLLRQDNADRRLAHYGREFGLISEEEFATVQEKESTINRKLSDYEKTRVYSEKINEYLATVQESPITAPVSVEMLARRGPVKLRKVLEAASLLEEGLNEDIIEQCEIELKYKGYIERQLKDIARFQDQENKRIPDSIDYTTILSLSKEAREKLQRRRPQSLGQATRIAGVSAADISILTVYLR